MASKPGSEPSASRCFDQGSVLRFGKGSAIIALKFDAHRKIVEPGSPYAQRRVPPAGATGMPGTLVGIDELNALAVATDQQMGRYPQVGDLGKERVSVRGQSIGE